MTPIFGGMDFGTSNSTVAIMRDGRPELVPLEDGQVTLPSAIFFNFEDNRTLFGRKAIADYTEGAEGRLMRALKSVLGSSLSTEKTRIKARSIAFYRHHRHVRRRTEAAAGAPCRRAGRTDRAGPAGAFRRRRRAGRCAGAGASWNRRRARRAFAQIDFQFEPIAAALDYEQSVAREELALIVDMGGGTSDFSVIRVSPERARASGAQGRHPGQPGHPYRRHGFRPRARRSRHVMPHLGYRTPTKDGKRNLPAGYFVDLATWQRINLLYTPKARHDLRQIRYEAERPDLVDRIIALVEHRHGHALATLRWRRPRSS